MDGVPVDNLEVRKQAFRIFFERYGIDKSAGERGCYLCRHFPVHAAYAGIGHRY